MEGVVGAASLLGPDRLDEPFADPLVERLFPPVATGVHWGLERTERALAALGDPHRSYATIHVGGTNGKGSVASTLASVLRAGGMRAACYTSPHLCSFRERMLIDGAPLSEELLLSRADDVRDVVLSYGLTFFEAVTVLGFHVFERASVDVAVVEVGLGGRLDATNVIQPHVAAVTNVALDHAEYLGSTLSQIAREKAGIVKPGVALVTAETEPQLTDVFRRITEARGAPLCTLDAAREIGELEVTTDHTAFGLDSHVYGRLHLRTPLVGSHQATNAALAVRVLEYLPPELRPDSAAVIAGVASVEYHGRDEIARTADGTWLFDVAHNTAGILSLVDTVDRLDLPRPLIALVGVLGDKDWRTMLPPLFSRVEAAVLTQPPSAPPERRWDAREAADAVGHITHLRLQSDFVRAMGRARAEAGEGTVIVTGSVHTVGSALKVLGREPLAGR